MLLSTIIANWVNFDIPISTIFASWAIFHIAAVNSLRLLTDLQYRCSQQYSVTEWRSILQQSLLTEWSSLFAPNQRSSVTERSSTLPLSTIFIEQPAILLLSPMLLMIGYFADMIILVLFLLVYEVINFWEDLNFVTWDWSI